MADKKPVGKHGYLLAFVVGIALMAVVYFLFGAANRARTGSEDSESGQTHSSPLYTSVVQTSGGEESSSSPSAFLGVEIISVNSVIAEQLGISGRNGVLVNSVVPGSPAQAAGLMRGDVIVALNNRVLKDVDAFKEIMVEFNPADRVRITYIRNGRKDLAYAELVEIPAVRKTALDADPGESGWGVSLSPITPLLRRSLDIPPDVDGVAILSVTPGGPADQAGLAAGGVIRGIDRTPVSDMDDFFRAISADGDDTALLDVYTRGAMRYVPMDSSALKVADQVQTQTTLRQKIFSIFTGGSPDNMTLASGDNVAFNRPSTVPGDVNTGGTSSSGGMGSPGGTGSSGGTGMNRPSEVPPQLGGSINDIVLFVGLLLVALVYLAYREYHRPPDPDRNR